MKRTLRIRQRLGKYRIEKRLGEGGFAVVYQAMDTIQGIRVALKIPHQSLITPELMAAFRKEIRTTAALEHPNILQIRDASIIDDRLVMVFPLGKETLDERLSRRMSSQLSMDLIHQVLEAVSCAHSNNVVHCDIKPENVILFENGVARLSDFGIAKVSLNTLQGSGTGTVGYMAPEQAMGRPSFQSDVFSLGLTIWRMVSGEWPLWPFEWPYPGAQKVRARVSPEFIRFVRKATDINPRKRYRDAVQMLNVFRRVRPKKQRSAKRTGKAIAGRIGTAESARTARKRRAA